MNSPRFVHLRLHSEYSVVDGNVRLDDAVKAAAKDGMGALALTDLANAFGLVRFYKEARGKGVKPIVGADVWITNHDERDKPARLLLLVRSKQGYLNLCQLLARAWLSNQHRGRAEIAPEWFDEPGVDDAPLATGLLALSGGMGGDIGMALANRELMQSLRESGEITGGPRPFGKSDRSEFLNRLETTVQAARRRR